MDRFKESRNRNVSFNLLKHIVHSLLFSCPLYLHIQVAAMEFAIMFGGICATMKHQIEMRRPRVCISALLKSGIVIQVRYTTLANLFDILLTYSLYFIESIDKKKKERDTKGEENKFGCNNISTKPTPEQQVKQKKQLIFGKKQ